MKALAAKRFMSVYSQIWQHQLYSDGPHSPVWGLSEGHVTLLSVTDLCMQFLQNGLGTRRFITVFTSAGYRTLCWTTWIQFKLIYLSSIFILLYHLRQVACSLQVFGITYLCAFLNFPMPATCLSHPNPIDIVTLVISGEEHKLWRCVLCNFLHALLRTLFRPVRIV
jgi:hypothetical protein